MSAPKKVVIVGGHGNVSLKLAKLLSTAGHSVVSVIRDEAQSKDITSVGATPSVLSLESSPVSDFTALFSDGVHVVYFSAGAGGKGGEARTKAVDYEGAIKVFDALDQVKGGKEGKPRLVLLSAVDIRSEDKVPEHYDDQDKAMSTRIRGAIPHYMHYKYLADLDLSKRTGFRWTILRPGGLDNNEAKGTADVGRTHIVKTISRQDVAQALYLLLDRSDASGLAIDIVGGDTPIGEGLDKFIKKGETDFLG